MKNTTTLKVLMFIYPLLSSIQFYAACMHMAYEVKKTRSSQLFLCHELLRDRVPNSLRSYFFSLITENKRKDREFIAAVAVSHPNEPSKLRSILERVDVYNTVIIDTLAENLPGDLLYSIIKKSPKLQKHPAVEKRIIPLLLSCPGQFHHDEIVQQNLKKSFYKLWLKYYENHKIKHTTHQRNKLLNLYATIQKNIMFRVRLNLSADQIDYIGMESARIKHSRLEKSIQAYFVTWLSDKSIMEEQHAIWSNPDKYMKRLLESHPDGSTKAYQFLQEEMEKISSEKNSLAEHSTASIETHQAKQDETEESTDMAQERADFPITGAQNSTKTEEDAPTNVLLEENQSNSQTIDAPTFSHKNIAVEPDEPGKRNKTYLKYLSATAGVYCAYKIFNKYNKAKQKKRRSKKKGVENQD